MPAVHPHRSKLADIIAQELREGIATLKWAEWLPQERVLADELKVSRSTLRQALNRLQAEGTIERLHSKGSRILKLRKRRKAAGARPLTVNLVTPGLSPEVRRAAAHWVEELQAQLGGRGGYLRILAAKSCYTRRPERALLDLMRHNLADCWIFRLSSVVMQRWLAQRDEPVIIAGTCHPGVDLAFFDIDHRAMSRHATAAILAAGHRRIALFVDSDRKAGDVESERGFEEAIAAGRYTDIEASVTCYPEGVAGMIQQLDRLLRAARPPTAILVTQAIYCLTIWGYLSSKGVRIPNELSVVAQVGTSDLSYLVPEPAFYLVDRKNYVRKLMRLIDAKIAGDAVPRENLVLPKFVRGKSLASQRTSGL